MSGFPDEQADYSSVERKLPMAQKDLRRVQRAAVRLEQARIELRDAILAAAKMGESLRDIAPFAGISRSRVHELLTEAQELERRRQREGQD